MKSRALAVPVHYEAPAQATQCTPALAAYDTNPARIHGQATFSGRIASGFAAGDAMGDHRRMRHYPRQAATALISAALAASALAWAPDAQASETHRPPDRGGIFIPFKRSGEDSAGTEGEQKPSDPRAPPPAADQRDRPPPEQDATPERQRRGPEGRGHTR